MSRQNLHASCVAIGPVGLLIRGPTGSGKSDLVLRLLDENHGAALVADDQVMIDIDQSGLIARPPDILVGKLEIRGQGIVSLPYQLQIRLSHIIDLVPMGEIARMPTAQELQAILFGHEFPRLKLDARQASATARIRAFLQR